MICPTRPSRANFAIIWPVSPEQVQAILSDFQRHATRLHTRGDRRETWRFGVDQHEYHLHFYPDDDTPLKRYLGGAAAAREFTQLQALQKLAIPATRVIANLKGFRLGERKGDACIIVHDPTTLSLDRALHDPVSKDERLGLQAELIERLEALHRHKLCPTPLHLHTFGRRGGKVLLTDGSVKQAGIVDVERLAELDRSTRHVTSRTDRLRMWKHFRDERPPRHDRHLARLARQLSADALEGENGFGTIHTETPQGDWTGRCLLAAPLTLPWSLASTIPFEERIWSNALPGLLAAVGQPLKHDGAARIESMPWTVAGQTLELVIKRPTVREGLFARLRESRVRRMWRKTWRVLGSGFACEVPLVMAERRVGARVVEQLLIVERVPGPTLAQVELDALKSTERDRLLYLAGRTLRQIERLGATHCDAKATNWIAWTDPHTGRVKPVLIDLDGIRFYRWRGMGYERLNRAMKQHTQITPHDLATLRQGYRPSPLPLGEGKGEGRNQMQKSE
jgi:Lipopolysaccharide kinase (Kdo/WaaP) family